MQNFMLSTLILIFSFSVYASSVPIYKSKDEKGNISYSDKKATSQNEALHLPPLSTYTSPSLPVDSSDNNAAPLLPIKTSVQAYKMVFIAPKNDHIFTHEIDSIEISLLLEPSLQADDRIILKANGNALGGFRDNPNFKIDRLDRGSYKLQAFVYSKSNLQKPKGQTEIITIYQIREMIRKKAP
ncbi:DUF4124 domain-containing protein [Candidatus Berkiella cookevillensis]|uniref:DUF4124 domain-containing protein n=1 Tax=Candidatus Berkiella cookevillensis TaxID=437022 RepID=A0A0Q9YE29_9GAMM|nr:DUF4124 domain-containing protein [Candidatus Berkiella cookevillensis]MCS5709649.1 DUF4124 domain-containing protein [Candidatus Berkiella cookevillensis]